MSHNSRFYRLLGILLIRPSWRTEFGASSTPEDKSRASHPDTSRGSRERKGHSEAEPPPTLSASHRPTRTDYYRERQVAGLIAAGGTNRQIGTRLGISEKTVEVHVRNTMAKLGARSRAEIAAWAVSAGLYLPGDNAAT